MRLRFAWNLSITAIVQFAIVSVLLTSTAIALPRASTNLASARAILQNAANFLSKPLVISTSQSQVGPERQIAVAFQANATDTGYLLVFLPEEIPLGAPITLTLNLPTFNGVAIAPQQMGLERQEGVSINAGSLGAILASNPEQLGSFCEASGTGLTSGISKGETLAQGTIAITDQNGVIYKEAETHIGILTESSLALTSSPESQPSCGLEPEPFDIETGEGVASRSGDGAALGEGDLAASSDMEWCISWFSSQCKKKKQSNGSKKCNVGSSCHVSYTRLLSWALASPSSVAQACAEMVGFAALAQCLEDAGIGWGGRCGKVYVLGIVSAGCQCVLS